MPVRTRIVKKKCRMRCSFAIIANYGDKTGRPGGCGGGGGQRLIFWCAWWKGETVTRMCGRTVALAERWHCLIAVRSRTSALTLIAECHTLCELHERNNCPPHLISVINFTFVRSPFQCNLVLCVATYIHYSLSPGNLLHLFDLRWEDDDSAVFDEMKRDYASSKSSFALIDNYAYLFSYYVIFNTTLRFFNHSGFFMLIFQTR